MHIDKGIKEFNEGRFFEAHEEWEKEWRAAEETPEKHFLQGMIMIAAALRHYEKKEYTGTQRLIKRGLELLETSGEAEIRIDKKEFVEAVRRFYETVNIPEPAGREREFPRIKEK